MRKIILAVLLCVSVNSFSQEIISKLEEVSIDQYELLKKVNQYYPDITLNKQVNNFYANGKIIDSQQEFILKDTKFSSYKLGIEPDNRKVVFEYESAETGKVYGDVSVFKGNAIRTTYSDAKRTIEISINGKAEFQKTF